MFMHYFTICCSQDYQSVRLLTQDEVDLFSRIVILWVIRLLCIDSSCSTLDSASAHAREYLFTFINAVATSCSYTEHKQTTHYTCACKHPNIRSFIGRRCESDDKPLSALPGWKCLPVCRMVYHQEGLVYHTSAWHSNYFQIF